MVPNTIHITVNVKMDDGESTVDGSIGATIQMCSTIPIEDEIQYAAGWAGLQAARNILYKAGKWPLTKTEAGA